MPKLLKAVCLLISLCLQSAILNAQQYNYRFRHFTIDDGLSQGMVNCITQDAQGFMWFGTKDGLNKFNGYSFTAYRHDPFDQQSISGNYITSLFSDSKGRLWIGVFNGDLNLYDRQNDKFIPVFSIGPENKTQQISAITEDAKGNIWVGTYGNGIYRIAAQQTGPHLQHMKAEHFSHVENDSTSISDDFVLSIFVDYRQHLWVSTTSGEGMRVADLSKNRLVFASPRYPLWQAGKKAEGNLIRYSLPGKRLPGNGLFKMGGKAIFEDQNRNLWFGTQTGLFLLDSGRSKVTYFDPVSAYNNDGHVLSVCSNVSISHSPGERWLGMFGGIGIFNVEKQTLRLLKHDAADNSSVQEGRILSVFCARDGSIWGGSNGYGLSKFSAGNNRFPYPQFVSDDNFFNATNLSVRSFCKFPEKNILLIGANNGLFLSHLQTGSLSEVKGSNIGVVYSIIDAGDNKAWVAYNKGLALFDIQTGVLKDCFYGDFADNIADKRIFKSFRENKNKIWLLTASAFIQFDVTTETFTPYYFKANPDNPFSEPAYGDILPDSQGNFWLGTPHGLLYFDTAKHAFTSYVNDPEDITSLSFNEVRSLLADPAYPEKYIWVGTAGGGLNKLDIHTRTFTHYTIKNGLPNNVLYGMLADQSGNLWLSTNKGLSKFNPERIAFRNYDISDGLQSNEFNANAYYKSPDGEMYFGGIRGFNAFYPNQIKPSPYIPPVVFTGLLLFNNPVLPAEEGALLQHPVSETKTITLAYWQNIISFEVAALDYTEPHKNQYTYQLEHFNESWIPLRTERVITFSNLSPGKYILHVKGSNNDGVWNEAGTSVTLIVTPPWWKTRVAYLLYVMTIMAVLYYIWQYNNKKLELKHRLEFEFLHSKKLAELNHLKSKFFANISHEFRTPLTLIIGPLEDLLQNGNDKQFRKVLPEMYRNSKRLLRLINQLLDLSKLDAGDYPVNTNKENIFPFVKQVVNSFSSLAEKRGVTLKVADAGFLQQDLEDASLRFYFDGDIIEKILYNLISNAMRFTPRDGNVTVSLTLPEKHGTFLELKVEDNGAGIEPDHLPFIFDRFYRVDDLSNRQYEGTGIGLSLVKELVEMHGGSIMAESDPGKGATFRCYLPLNKKTTLGKYNEAAPFAAMPAAEENEVEEKGNDAPLRKALPVVLIVEDQADVRKYIREKLIDAYNIIEATNGNEGYDKAVAQIPDLVISDIMMPGRDGFELCRLLKQDHRTSHVPVILLTARADDADKLTGLENRADAYLIKPFNAKELLISAHNLIALRNSLRSKFSKKLVVKPSEITVTSQDSLFMQGLLDTVEAHISDEQFSVEQLAHEFGMSASQINRKLKAIINQSAVAFIRSVRMQRALVLLRKNSATIAEIAYDTGFSDPAYFSRVFKIHFGYSPSEAKKTE